ncbi:MAG: FkbM family methyltransferase [Proteobacteria bacterium]|nr:MAG: FkbM family methyltransferase [Pseudomonadota bacterium]
MALKFWKKFEKSDFFQSAKLKLRQSYGREPKFNVEKTCDITVFGDWGLPLNALNPNDIVYSFGVCDDIDFELALIKLKNVHVFAFDPTPYSVDWMAQQSLPKELQFYPLAAAAQDGEFYLYPLVNKKGKKSTIMYSFSSHQEARNDGVLVKALSLKSTMEKLNHNTIDVLKMDIEGAEFAFIKSVIESDIRPRLIMVEFHHRFKDFDKQDTIDTVALLRQAGYQIVYISPAGREMCFFYQ